MNLAKKSVLFRRNIRNSVFKCKEILYLIKTRRVKTNPKIILFQSYMGQSYACSPKALYKQICKMDYFKDFTFVWGFVNPDQKNDSDLDNCIKVKYRSSEYYRYMSRAKYWITNTRMPDHVVKRKDQVYVQCWHGTPLKKLGFDIAESNNILNTKKEMDDKYAHDAKKYDYFISPSKFASERFRSGFNLKQLHVNDIIIEKGYPRNDFLFTYTDKDVKRVRMSLSIPSGKKVILYAPTWRDNQYESGVGYTYKLNVNFDKWREALGGDFVILFRAHYHVAKKFDFAKYKGFVYDVSKVDDINDCYIISDMLITDYSSVFFDYANLKKPILFYMYDLDFYRDKMRGFYINLDELPGPIFEDEKVLIENILSKDLYKDIDLKYNDFNVKYNYLDGPNTSSKVIKAIIVDDINE